MKSVLQSPELQEVIDRAEAKSLSLAWPRASDEEWRRSSPSLIPFDRFESAKQPKAEILKYQEQSYGQFQESLKKTLSAHKELSYIPWTDAQAGLIAPILDLKLKQRIDKIDAWRLSCLNDSQVASVGGIIILPKNYKQSRPLSLDLKGFSSETVLCPQLVVLVDEDATCSLDLCIEGDAFFSLGLYVFLAKNSSCKTNIFQNAGLDSYLINSLFADCEENSNFINTSGQLGGMMSIDRVYARNTGTKSNVHLNGYYFALEDQLMDMRTYQHHDAIDANSRSLYHGVAIDESHTIYRGLIQVGDDAIETDAYLTNKNLLLSENARMDSIPCLNIKTNDVRCSHGATTGTLNPEHIYYLKTRGLSDADAKELLIEGFFEVIFDEAFESSNERARAIIRERIRNTL